MAVFAEFAGRGLIARTGKVASLVLRLYSCHIENFRALRNFSLELDESTVIVGENGCGKSSLFHALEVCLGPQAPDGDFAIVPDDFHRGPNDEPGQIRLELNFAEDGRPEDALLWIPLRQAGLVDHRGQLGFRFEVKAELGSNGPDVRYVFSTASEVEHSSAALLAEVRRVLPFIRIRNGIPASTAGLCGDEPARDKVHRQIHASLAQLVEADAVPEHVVAAARDAVFESLGRFAPRDAPEPASDPRSLVMAPLSASGTWAQMSDLLLGSGARSLAMLAFAGAFLEARGPRTLESDTRPLISVEEPESKLHPLMLTSVWSLIQRMPVQKIVTTNSADLLAAMPLGNLRRMVRDTMGRATTHRVPSGGMPLDELRRVAYHLRIRRGSALFMRFWLLVEGETEFWLLSEIARALEIDLRREGVECLEFAQSGLGPLVRLASHLHIGWHLLCDGDRAGQSYFQQASLLADAVQSRVTVLAAHDIEHCLWAHGYRHVYLAAAGLNPNASRRTKPRVVIDQAVRRYSKPELALMLGEAMRAPGSPGVPEPLERLVRDAAHWAAHGRFP